MDRLLTRLHDPEIDFSNPSFESLVTERQTFLQNAKGNFKKFQAVVEQIPAHVPSSIHLNEKAVQIGTAADISEQARMELRFQLEQLCPWRKGPFNIFGISIDSEWQSWMKWERLAAHIGSLENRKILDIGSSNGYYMFKMAAHNPLMVLGVEPQSAFYCQYLALQKFLQLETVFCLPAPYDMLPPMDHFFDTVFCMGILYHRKSPVEMLKQIFDSLRPGGELVLENLVIDKNQGICLFPKDRYAKMRNVFFIPDLLAMESWLYRAGFSSIRCVKVEKTTLKEQRKTSWIYTESLDDFLDPDDSNKTVEGYPAPVRAIFTANA